VAAPPRPPAELAAPQSHRRDPRDPEYDLTGSRYAEPPLRNRTGRPRPAADRRRVGAARMLVLALVVSAEGVALTSMSGAPHLRSDSAALAAAALQQAEADTRQAQAVQAAAALAAAQAESGDAKVEAALAQAKAAADRVRAAAERREAAMRRALRNAQRDPRSVARLLMADYGWGDSQFSCLDRLWTRESQWNYRAQNPSSGAYGIPQSLPGSKMGSVASDWRTNPVTQIKWGLGYISDRYGTPCGAWAHSESVGWY
jgi:hypothetical protein